MGDMEKTEKLPFRLRVIPLYIAALPEDEEKKKKIKHQNDILHVLHSNDQ